MNIQRVAHLACAFILLQTAHGGVIYDVTLNTTPLVSHAAAPFYFYVELLDGSQIGDGNNTVTINDIAFGGGSSLGNPLLFGGVVGSLASGIGITDSSPTNLFAEQFTPGVQLSFALDLTTNDDLVQIPDRFTFFILDSTAVPLPTLAPFGDYFLGADLGSGGPVVDAYGSDPFRSPSVGDPVSIAAPILTLANSPEPSTEFLLVGALFAMAIFKHREKYRARLNPDFSNRFGS